MALSDLLRTLPVERFVKFCVVGGSGVGVNYGVYIPLTRWLGFLEEVAQVAAIAVSIFTNFLLNDLWTFRDRRRGGFTGALRRLGRFYLVSIAGGVLNYCVFIFCLHWLGVYDLLAVLFGIAVATLWNFVVNLLWTWRKPSGQRGGAAG